MKLSSRTSGFRTSNCSICHPQQPRWFKQNSCFQVKRLAYFSVIACVMLCFVCARKIGTMMISNDWPNLDCSDHRVMSPWNKKTSSTSLLLWKRCGLHGLLPGRQCLQQTDGIAFKCQYARKHKGTGKSWRTRWHEISAVILCIVLLPQRTPSRMIIILLQEVIFDHPYGSVYYTNCIPVSSVSLLWGLYMLQFCLPRYFPLPWEVPQPLCL